MEMPKAHIINADVLDGLRDLESESVQCIITSPPYWGLRDYGVDLQIGLEQTPEEYIKRMVEVFHEARRVLRDDGVLWLNLGDCYARDAAKGQHKPGDSGKQGYIYDQGGGRASATADLNASCLKPKDLVGIPWRVAFALQADGWWLRSDVIWAKPNPMPESVKDRPTSSHEYVFLFTKSERYFYDHEAVKEASVTTETRPPAGPGQESIGGRPASRLRVPSGWDTGPGSHQGKTGRYKADPSKKQDALGKQTYTGFNARCQESGAYEKRNLRTVWFIPTEPFPDAHFATFPQKLVEPMVKSGTSEQGKCPSCGAPWIRVTEYLEKPTHSGSDWRGKREQQMEKGKLGGAGGQGGMRPEGSVGKEAPRETTGWLPSCECKGTPPHPRRDSDGLAVPCVVLDPFSGAATTGLVACKLGRDYIGIELNPEYAKMARDRIYNDAPLFNEVK